MKIKRTRVLGIRADFVLIYRVFSAKQPENVLKLFLKLFLIKIKYCIDYQQMKSMCKHDILIN